MTLKEEFEAYNSRGIYPFHMPGHKRNEALLRSLGAIGNESSYSRDYTETEGLDNLYTASGILRESMDKAARLFGSDICWFLVNGSTCGLLTGIFSLLGQGETALIARNCHKAVYNALFLRGAKTEYLMPPVDPSTGIYGSIRPEDVEEALSRHPDIRLVVITSPTYEGVVSNVASIARICHSRGIPLLVDEAHGSHMRFSSFFPESAVKAGADIVIHSVHKTLPSVTQTALLHINTKSGLVSPEVVQRYLTSFQTSSPSYIFMESIDACRHILEHHPELFSVYEERLSLFSERMKGLKRLSVVIKGTDTIESHPVFYAYDGGKIVISTKGTPLTGRDLELLLLRKYGLQLEMSSLTYAIAMTSICDTEEGFRRLGDALLAIDAIHSGARRGKTSSPAPYSPFPSSAKNFLLFLRSGNSAGRICEAGTRRRPGHERIRDPLSSGNPRPGSWGGRFCRSNLLSSERDPGRAGNSVWFRRSEEP